MAAMKPMTPTKVAKWHADDWSFMMQTSLPFSAFQVHPCEEMHPKTMIAKSWEGGKTMD